MGKKIQVVSPIDGSIYVERTYASEKDIHESLALSHKVRESWQQTSIKERQLLCENFVSQLLSHREEIAKEISWQMGRPILYAGGELDGLAERAEYMIAIADKALSDIYIPPKEGFERFIQKEPLGTCFIVAPWNYPYLTAVNSIIPALLSGNTVILKHSAQTPLVAERFFQAFEDAGFPKGVFQYLHLTHEDTQRLIQSEWIDSVTFTGSVAGGRHIEKSASGRFIPIGLELGGKDAAYVRHDADLDNAVATVIDGAFFNSGQSCCGIERIYVHKNCFDEFVLQAQTLVNNYRLGPANELETTLGPMVSHFAADKVRGEISKAVSQGATALIDSKRFAYDKVGTAYLAPQILVDVNHSMSIMSEDSFGPVVGIMPVNDDKQAINLINDSQYGLTASVFTKDTGAAIEIGKQLQCGTFFVNRCDYLDPALAWTGVKNSGRGVSLSELSFDSFTQAKSFHIKQG